MSTEPPRDALGLSQLVAREQHAHEVDDVLANSQALKDRFPHVALTPARQRLEAEWERLLEHVGGMRVLDYGCGRGVQAVQLASRGALVTGIDISENYARSARELADASGVEIEALQMDAHNLTFPDETFDRIVGRGILHHLEIPTAISEIRRVLRPNGIAVFVEPLAGNPLLKVFRAATPSARTSDEHPLTSKDLRLIANRFEVSSSHYSGVISTPAAVLTSVVCRERTNNRIIRATSRLDQILERHGWFNSWQQYVLLLMRKPA